MQEAQAWLRSGGLNALLSRDQAVFARALKVFGALECRSSPARAR
jgi:hypothetical protein